MALTDLIPWKREKEVPIRREPSDPFAELQRQMFDDFFSLSPFEQLGGTFQPSVDVNETDTKIEVLAELPGLDEDDIELSLVQDRLTIKGEKREEKEDKGKNYYRVERSYGAFQRAIPLPAEVESDKAEASLKKGVLRITLPKTAEAKKQRRKIAIKRG